jgi:hypothetical protein
MTESRLWENVNQTIYSLCIHNIQHMKQGIIYLIIGTGNSLQNEGLKYNHKVVKYSSYFHVKCIPPKMYGNPSNTNIHYNF